MIPVGILAIHHHVWIMGNAQKDTQYIYAMTLRPEMTATHYTGGEAKRMEAQQD